MVIDKQDKFSWRHVYDIQNITGFIAIKRLIQVARMIHMKNWGYELGYNRIKDKYNLGFNMSLIKAKFIDNNKTIELYITEFEK